MRRGGERGNKKDPFAGKEKEAKKGLEMEKEGGFLGKIKGESVCNYCFFPFSPLFFKVLLSQTARGRRCCVICREKQSSILADLSLPQNEKWSAILLNNFPYLGLRLPVLYERPDPLLEGLELVRLLPKLVVEQGGVSADGALVGGGGRGRGGRRRSERNDVQNVSKCNA